MTSGIYIDWDKKELEALYWNKQLNTEEIAKIKGVNPSTIRGAITHLGIKKRTLSEVHKLMCSKGKTPHLPPHFVGEKHPNWKGGRRKVRGYVLILIPDHQRANKGYVFEHIVVWEKAHGKPVPKNHHIHHLNGVRDDNRPENLVVVSKFKHPPFTFRRLLQNRIRELEQKILDLKNQKNSEEIAVRDLLKSEAWGNTET